MILTLMSLLMVDAEPVEARLSLARAERPSTSSWPTGGEPQTALDAERAFVAMVEEKGQWTAFRATAHPEAWMFVPEAVKARTWLNGRSDPAQSVRRWPTAAWVSCDGRHAVTTGGTLWPDGSHGFFTTVWRRERDGGWRWLVDHGGPVSVQRPVSEAPVVTRASCEPGQKPILVSRYAWKPGVRAKITQPGDKTVAWSWAVRRDGSREINISLWTGSAYEAVLTDDVPAP